MAHGHGQHVYMVIIYTFREINSEVTWFSVAVAVEKRRFFVDNLLFGVQLADVSTRCSSHLEARCENAGYLQAWLMRLHAHTVGVGTEFETLMRFTLA